MIKLTLTQARVYFILREKGRLNVTQIAAHLDDRYAKPTSSVTRPLKALVDYGLVGREAKNRKIVTYGVVIENPPPFIIAGDDPDRPISSIFDVPQYAEMDI